MSDEDKVFLLESNIFEDGLIRVLCVFPETAFPRTGISPNTLRAGIHRMPLYGALSPKVSNNVSNNVSNVSNVALAVAVAVALVVTTFNKL